jgi:hypothetical protein
MDKKYLKKVAKVCRRLGPVENTIPGMRYPEAGTSEFSADLDEVVRCYNSPCLSSSMLELTNESVEKTFREFLEREYSGFVDWDEIEKLLEEVDSIIARMKHRYNRPRPKNFLVEISDSYNDIDDIGSPSFPSGHTGIAYFLSGVLSHNIPELEGALTTLAELIGQSRIENGVHFPSDVMYGRLVGEMLSDAYNDGENTSSIGSLGKKSYKQCSRHLRDIALKNRPTHSREDALLSYARDLGEYIFRTNEIERYNLNFDECQSAAREFLMGYPTEYITNNSYIASILNGLVYSFLTKPISSVQKIIQIHKSFPEDVLERDLPGSLRSFSHFSPSGVAYPEPCDILKNLKKCFTLESQPVLKHIVYEWVHPFSDGNGRSGRIFLASDLDFNFDIINQVIDENYIKMLRDFMGSRDMNTFVGSL